MPIKLFKFAGILVQTLDEEKICSLDIVDDSISVHSVHHFMYIDLFATYSEFSGGQSCCICLGSYFQRRRRRGRRRSFFLTHVRVPIIEKKNKRGRVRRREAPEREKTKEKR